MGVADALSSVFSRSAPGDLAYDEDTIRVWVEDEDHAPAGHVLHREDGLFYYDVPLDEAVLESLEPPEEFWDVAAFDTTKAWMPYRGPMGGEGWINSTTGDVRYTDQIPRGAEAEGALTGSERELMEAVDEEDPDETAAAIEELVGDELGMSAGELVEESTSFTGPPPDGEKVARTAIQELMGRRGRAIRQGYTEETTEAMTRLVTGLQELMGGAEEKADYDLDYSGAGERAQPEVREAMERWRNEDMDDPDDTRRETPLLYWLLGEGTPAFKMPKEAADYQREPEGDQRCANCEYMYEEVATGKGICSQVRGEVERDHWCRLWTGALGGVDEKAWVPYTGPRGGEGWQNPATGRTVYQGDPPGSVIDPDDVDNEALSTDIDRQLSDRGLVVRPDGDVLDIEDEEVVGRNLAGERVMGRVKDIETAEDGDVYLVVLDPDGFSHHVPPDDATKVSDLTDEKAWVPYEGPQGGAGWQDTDSGDVVYQRDPPGGVADPDDVPDEVYEEFADRYDTTPERIRDHFESAFEEHGGGMTSEQLGRVNDILGTPEEDGEWERRMEEDPGADPVEVAYEVHSERDDDLGEVEEQYPEVGERLLEVAEELVAEGECEDVQGVNDGFCRYAAEQAYERSGLPDDVEILENGNRSSHHFIEYDGKYYDAEAPGGVDDWRDLPFFERTAAPPWDPDVVTPEDEKGLDEADHRPAEEVLEEEPTTNTLGLKGRVPVGSAHEAPEGVVVHADPDGGLYYEEPADEKQWVPYEGPQGGSGWKNLVTDDVVYQEEPPGEVIGEDELWDALGRAGLDPDEVQNIVDAAGLAGSAREEAEMVIAQQRAEEAGMDLGDRVQVDVDGREVEGELIFHDGDWAEIVDDRGIHHEVEAEDVEDVVEEADEPGPEWIKEGYGSYHPDKVTETMTADDYLDGLAGVDSPGSSAHEIKEMIESGESPRDAITEVYGHHSGHKLIKELEREHRLADNSAPEHLDPTNAEEVVDLNDTASTSGISASAMDVATMPDGSEVYITYVEPRPDLGRGSSAESTYAAEQAVGAAKALEAMGVEVPDHHYEHNRFYAVEGVDGTLAADAGGEGVEVTNPDQAMDTLAAGILVGNRDQHGANVAVVDGKLVPFDLDLSGNNAADFPVSGSAYIKAASTAYNTGAGRDALYGDEDGALARQKIAEHLEYRAMRMASELDADEIAGEIPNENMAQQIRENIENLAERFEEEWG